MKNTLIALGCLITLNVALAGEPAPADQKWLSAVQTMIAEGQTRISTPSQSRVDLLKDWATKQSYSVEVKKNEKGFEATVSKRLASK